MESSTMQKYIANISAEKQQEIELKIAQIYDQIKGSFADKKIDAGEVISAVVLVMELAEKLPKTTGAERKIIVIEVVKKIVVEYAGGDATLLAICDQVLPFVIDKIVDASKSKIAINIVKKVKSWFKCI